jgi:DinB superfamily
MVRRAVIPVVSVMTLLMLPALIVRARAQAADPKMTRAERAELIDLLNKSEKEFLDAVESVSDAQWAFKAGPDRWSIGEVAEHLVLAEAGLFTTATRSVAAPADDKWTATVGKTDLLKRALPNRTTKVDAPQEIRPRGDLTRAQVMARFKEQRARTLAFAQETEAPLKAHTAPNPFFGAINAHQLLLYIPLHNLRHDQQIAEVKTAPDYPR